MVTPTEEATVRMTASKRVSPYSICRSSMKKGINVIRTYPLQMPAVRTINIGQLFTFFMETSPSLNDRPASISFDSSGLLMFPFFSARIRSRRNRRSRSEEHTSELQSRGHLVCRLLLEKENKNTTERKTVMIETKE